MPSRALERWMRKQNVVPIFGAATDCDAVSITQPNRPAAGTAASRAVTAIAA
jgi:hypothetical protein